MRGYRVENVGCEVKAGLCMVNGRRSFLAALLMVFFVVPGRFSAQGYSASQNSGRFRIQRQHRAPSITVSAMTPPMGWSSWDNYRLVVNGGYPQSCRRYGRNWSEGRRLRICGH